MDTRRHVRIAVLALLATWPAVQAAEIRTSEFHDRPAHSVANDRLELTVLDRGGAIASVTIAGAANAVNPLWDAIAQDMAAGRAGRATSGLGHFLCLDGFGPVSEEEAKAGLPGHGEAHTLPWVLHSQSNGREAVYVQTVQLPLTQEVYQRTIRLADGENVIAVEASLESLLAFDRPVNWAEHATIGPPFLKPETTVVDIAPSQSMTRPHELRKNRLPHRLVSGKEFAWPMAPTLAGGTVDLRAMPASPHSLDHTAHRFDPARQYAWVTALDKDSGMLLGYVFPREDYPWLQTWENYPENTAMSARGLEFGTQAFDLPRREVVTDGRIFGELLYRWLPAKSKITARYLLFWVKAPSSFQGVEDIAVDSGQLTVKGRGTSETLVLKSSSGI